MYDPPNYALEVVVRFRNLSEMRALKLLTEGVLAEGRYRQFGKYQTRVDNRPADQGGPQLHIRGPDGSWAYRGPGARSEPHKYNLRTTNKIRDMVSTVFDIPRSQIENCDIISANAERLLVEISFC
jgi:hypothetical protein